MSEAENFQFISVGKLKLDIANPRFEKSADQREAMEKLFQSENKKMVNLAEDIARRSLNPTQLMIVVSEDDNYIVLEGNRRLACIQCIIDPNRAPAEFRKDFIRISALDTKPPKEILCYVVAKREEANGWLLERHTGQNDGIGVSSWDTEQIRRFNVAAKGIPDRTLQLVDWIKAQAPDIAKLYQEKNMFTNLERLLNYELARKALGLTFKNGQLFAEVTYNALHKVLMRIVGDFHKGKEKGGITVDDIKTNANKDEYLDKIESDLPTETDKEEGKPLLTVEKPGTPTKVRGASIKDPNDRKHLIPRGFCFESKNQRLMEIVYELKKLDIDLYSNACSVLLRCLIEMSTYYYAEKFGVSGVKLKQGEWNKNWHKVIAFMEGNGTLNPSESAGVRKVASATNNDVLSYDTLHQSIHNPCFFPTKTVIIKIWSMVDPYLTAIGKSGK